MDGERFNNVPEMLESLGGEPALIEEVKKRVAARSVLSTLVAMRIANDVSQVDIAKELGCTQGHVSKLENGTDAKLKLEHIAAYARASKKCVKLYFPDESATLFECVKFHAFQIRDHLNQVANLSKGDAGMEVAAVHAHVETLVNMAMMIVDSAKGIPCVDSEISRLLAGDTDLVCGSGQASGTILSEHRHLSIVSDELDRQVSV